MTLLREVIERPLDGGYAEAAARRARGQHRRRGLVERVVIALLAAVLGFVAVWAARELRAPAPATGDARALLITEIEVRSQQRVDLQTDHAELVDRIAALQAEAVHLASDIDGELLQRQEMLAGTSRIRGPGLLITLDDSRDAQAGLEGSEGGMVLDRDLQAIVNGLWASGAEAIAINGQRLTSISAIRSAGPALLVDLVPLQRPYLVEAVGDGDQMRAEIAASSVGAYIHDLRENYGITVEIETSAKLELAGSPARTLRHAQQATEATLDPQRSRGSTGGVD